MTVRLQKNQGWFGKGWSRTNSGSLTATIHIPQGKTSPLSKAHAEWTRLADSAGVYNTGAEVLNSYGATDLILFKLQTYSTGWAVSGTSDDGTYIYISTTRVRYD